MPDKITNGRYKTLPILILIVVNLAIGAFTFQNYGESYDEPRLREYADQSLTAYRKLIQWSYQPDFGGDDLRYYGPAYVMGVSLTLHIIGLSDSGVITGDLWHLACFLTFQIAILSFYFIARRWLGNWVAFGSALLFSTQPLLWGHAFINPKDTPFMAFFLASIATGLWMNDRISPSSEWKVVNLTILPRVIKNWGAKSIQRWQDMPSRSRKNTTAVGVLWLFSTAFLLAGSNIINGLISRIVTKGYSAEPTSPIGHFFLSIAHNTSVTPVEMYILKAQTLFHTIKIDYLVVSAIFMLWVYRSVLFGPIRLPTKRDALHFLRQFITAFTKPAIVIAGVILGVTTSTRILGPLAGLIVSIYLLRKNGKAALAPLSAYALIAILTMLLTWPYLWANPIKNFMASFSVMSTFPWLGKVLFNGDYYFPNQLPISFLPTLFSIQFTEPVVILAGLGCIIAIYHLFHHKKFGVLGICLLWFFCPISFLIITHRPIYDNFRQLLFLVPSIFLLCGAALDVFLRSIQKWSINILILSLLIFPGIYNVIKLHPYEYIYYNSFIGGVDGAFRRFETDYWMTAYREASEYLNHVAPPNTRVVVWGMASDLAKPYLRPDIIAENERGNTYDVVGGYDFVIASSRHDNDYVYPQESPIFVVKRGKAILAVVKHLSPTSEP